MATLELLTGKNYLSYSAMSSWQECGQRFYLERVRQAPQAPAWWFFIGDVIHKATEDCDLDNVTDPDEAVTYFWSIWNREYPKIEDPSVLRAGGRKSKDWPDKENEDYWRVNGPAHVANWVKWRTDALDSGWQWWTLPNETIGVEVPLEVELGGVLVKGYVDRVMVNPDGELCVIDLKSGSRMPESSLQLGVYAQGISRKFNVMPSVGHFYMTRTGTLSESKSLLHYTEPVLGRWFAAAKRAIENEVFIPHVSSLCHGCTVAPYCEAVGGSESSIPTRHA